MSPRVARNGRLRVPPEEGRCRRGRPPRVDGVDGCRVAAEEGRRKGARGDDDANFKQTTAIPLRPSTQDPKPTPQSPLRKYTDSAARAPSSSPRTPPVRSPETPAPAAGPAMPLAVDLDTVFRALQAFDGAVLGAGVGLLALKSLNSHRFYSAASEQVRAAPVVSVDGLRSLLSEVDGNGGGKGSPLVFVGGQVWARSFLDFERGAKDPLLLSKGSSSRAVVIERSQTCMYDYSWGIFDTIFGLRGHFTELTKQYQSKTVETIPFVLTEDGLQPFKAFVVVNIDESKHALPLTEAYHHLKPVQPSFLTFLHAFFHGKCPVGILDEERILPVGKMITAVGICSMRDGVPEITSSKDIPYFLSENSKDKIEADLAVKSNARLGLAILLSIVSLGILGYSAWRNWTRWKSRSRRQQWLLEEAREADETESEVPDGQLCVVCLRKRRRSAFIPCGHLVCCSRCAHIIERDVTPLCPICRQIIRSSVWVSVH